MNPQIALFLILSILVIGAGVTPEPSITTVIDVFTPAEKTVYQPQIGNFTCSESFVCPDCIVTLGCVVNDLDGRETLVNASVGLSMDVILFWENETDKFSLIQNLNNYARLEYGSYSVARNSSAYSLIFPLSFRGNMTHGPVSVSATVYDNSSLCSYGNHTDLFVFGPAPEGWQTNPYPIQKGRVIGFEESAIILVVSLIIIAVLSLFASKRKKTTKEKYESLINVKPKRRNE